MTTRATQTSRKARPTARPFPLGAALAALAVLVVLVLIGISLFQNTQNSGRIVGSGPARGEPVPDFRATTLEGQPFQLSAERGKVVALYFAAAWCPTCVPEAQAWTQVYQKDHARGLEVVMLDVDTSEGTGQWADFRRRTGAGAQIWALDKGLQIASSYGVTSLETSVIIDRQGRLAFRHNQTVPVEQLQEEVGKLL